MKDKLLAALRSAYANNGISDKALAGIAAMGALNVKEDSEIAAFIASEPVKEAILGVQSFGDARAAKALETKQQEPPKEEPAKPNPGGDPAQPPKADEPPTWLKAITDQLATVTSELSAFKQGQTTNTRQAQLESKLEKAPQFLKDVITAGFKGMAFENEDAFKGYLTALEPSITTAIQAETTRQLTEQGAPIYGDPQGGASSFVSQLQGMGAKAEPAKV